MHLKSISIRDVRSFESVDWELDDDISLPGWHVVIGDNGSGKSTFLRAVSLALCGPEDIRALREAWGTWIRSSSDQGKITLHVESDDKWDKWAGRRNRLSNYYPSCGLTFFRQGTRTGMTTGVRALPRTKQTPERHLWSRKPGWFSAAYGPFRRFTGGDREQTKLFYSHPFLARHLTVFGENIALSESLEWLSQLRFRQLEKDEQSSNLLEAVRNFVNQQGFLPHHAQFERVTSKEVVFKNPEGISMDVTRLSDGFRSVLSLTFELIRQMVACYETSDIFSTDPNEGTVTVQPPGVVLVDEIDVHLPPTWQRRIGQWLTRYFPNLQFIVSTHSPLVCQAAEHGSIFRLPAPGGDRKQAGFVTGIDRERLIFGDVLDAYGTELFGGVDRSESAGKQLDELARLNQKALSKKLSRPEAQRQQRLREAFSRHAGA